MTTLKAPFPAFGGKSRAAGVVWSRLGPVSNYIEPFCFSAAMLLLRPDPPRIETVNDLNCYVANFWRAVKEDAAAVAEHADWPVNEADLHARHRWLVLSEPAVEFRQRMRTDPDYYDPKIAGWWCWGACCWIGSGWCDLSRLDRDQGTRPAISDSGGRGVHSLSEQLPDISGDEGATGRGVHASAGHKRPETSAQKPHLGDWGRGVHASAGHKRPETWAQKPHLADWNGQNAVNPAVNVPSELVDKRPVLSGRSERDNGHGVNRVPGQHSKRVPLGDGNGGSAQKGVNSSGKMPRLAGARKGDEYYGGNDDAVTCAQRREWLLEWFHRLEDRLRTVRVCCGHWRRVCDSPSVTTRLGTTGILLDPPYPTHEADGTESRSPDLYATDGDRDELDKLRDEVLAYCRDRGGDRRMRIAVCGYDTDGYAALEELGWECVAWKSPGRLRQSERQGEGQRWARADLVFTVLREAGKCPSNPVLGPGGP
jgi:hypothetical protein